MATYAYDAWGNMTYCNAGTDVAYINPFLYRGYYYDSESGLYYLMSRYYDPSVGQFISPDTMQTLNPNVIGGVDLYSYANNNPIAVKYDSSASSYGGGMISSVSSSVSFQGSFDGINQIAPGWMQTLVGAISDIFLGVKYLKAKGIHTKFAYSKNTRYMHPIMDRTWRWFGKSGSLLADFGTVAQASFKQILAGDARAKFGTIAKSIGGTIGLNFGVNAIFNLYENNWDYKNVDMWMAMSRILCKHLVDFLVF